MNYNFCVSRSRLASAVGGSPDLRQLARKDAKYRCLFFSKIAIHISIQQRRLFYYFYAGLKCKNQSPVTRAISFLTSTLDQ
jgi:uncharacterized protein (UPF0303 family)